MELGDITKEAAVVTSNATFAEAVAAMVRRQANALVVVDEAGKFVGEVNVSDLFEAVVPEHLNGDEVLAHFASEEAFVGAVRAAADKPVADFMSMNAEPVAATDSIISVAAAALAHQHSRIPVVDEHNRPLGVISRRGLKHIIGNVLGIRDAQAGADN